MSDLDRAEDLKFFIDSDSVLYNTLQLPLLKNYQKLLDKGEFSADLAANGFKHLTLAAGKKYDAGLKLATIAVRELTAQLMVSEFTIATSLGNRFE